MPNLPKTFENYPATVVLDSNGSGQIAFQPNGSTVSISRLYVSVSTSVKQATVTFYKGSVSPTNALGTIVSGSTGGLATGQIFVQDGTILYVVWTGGDAGATATATFSGKQISFSEMGSDSITWSDPIAASDGSLIFPALKSPNFVPSSSGWNLDRDGNAELNNVTVRGTVDVEGSLGNNVKIYTDSTLVPGETTATITMNPGSYSDGQLPVSGYGQITATAITGPPHYGQLLINSPGHNYASSIFMTGDTVEGGGINDTTMNINAASVTIGYNLPSAISKVTINRPRCLVNLQYVVANVITPVPNNTVVNLSTSLVLSDPFGMASLSGTDFTIKVAGDYECIINLNYATNATGFRQVRIVKNGSSYFAFTLPALTGFNTPVSLTIPVPGCVVGDKLNVGAYQNSGGTLSLTSTNTVQIARAID